MFLLNRVRLLFSIVVTSFVFMLPSSAVATCTVGSTGTFSGSGGYGVFYVSSDSGGCQWTVQPNNSWISIIQPNPSQLQSGQGLVQYYVQPNTTSTRNGSIAVNFTTQTPTTVSFSESATAAQNVYQEFWTPNVGWATQNITAFGGPQALPGGSLSSLYDTSRAQEHIFYVGSDLHLHHYYSYTGGWIVQDLGVGPAAGTTLTSFYDSSRQQQHVFYIGTNQHIHHEYFSGSWVAEDIGGNLPVGTTLTSLYETSTGDQYLYFISADGQIHQVIWAGSWSSAVIGTGALPGTITCLYDPLKNRRTVFYVGASDYQLHEIYWSGSAWVPVNLGQTPLAVSSLASLYDTRLSQEQVYYVTTGGNLGQVYLSGSTWAFQNLGGSPTQTFYSGLTTMFDSRQGQDHAFFLDANSDLNHWWSGNGHENLGAIAVGSPLTSVFDGQVQHVIYLHN